MTDLRPNTVIPVVSFVVTSESLGAACTLEVLAEHAGQVEDGLQLLEELQQCWGPGGELDALVASEVGRAVPLRWETLLLLGRLLTTGGSVTALTLDVQHGSGTRTGPLPRPAAEDLHAVAADLIAQELGDAGCLAARVRLGAVVRIVNPHEWEAFERHRARGEQVGRASSASSASSASPQ